MNMPINKLNNEIPAEFKTVGEIAFNISIATKANNGLLTKVLSIDEHNNLVKDSSRCGMSNGSLQTVQTTMKELPNQIENLTQSQALVITNHPFQGEQQIVTDNIFSKLDSAKRDGVIARTTECCKAVEGPSLLLFDVDTSNEYQSEGINKLLEDLATVIPSILSAARVITHSTSSHIYLSDGRELSGEGNFHIYFLIENINTIDLKKLSAQIIAKAWLVGLGNIFIDRAGRMHNRCLVDTAVFQHGRMVFEASAKLKNDLIQKRPVPEFSDGQFLDLREILEPLSYTDKLTYDKLINDAKEKVSVKAASIRNEHTRKRIRNLIEKGLTENQAQITVQSAIKGHLNGDHRLYFLSTTIPEAYRTKNNITEISVSTILQNPQDFDRIYCADPIEPDYGGVDGSIVPNKAIVLIRGNKVHLLSFAHGGQRFQCYHTFNTLKDHCEALKDQGEEVLVNNWINAANQISMDRLDEDRFIDFIHGQIKGSTKTSIKTLLKEAKNGIDVLPLYQDDFNEMLFEKTEVISTPQSNKERQNSIWPKIKHIAQDSNLLNTIVEKVQETGVVGEDNLIIATYLVAISPMLGKSNTLNLLVRGESSLGKSHVIKKTLNFFPKDHVFIMTDASAKSFYYMAENELKGRVVFLQEANCLTDQDHPMVIAIRSLLSEGRIEYPVVIKSEVTGQMTTEKKIINGPTSLITSSTKHWLDQELETRLTAINPDDSAEQTQNIFNQLSSDSERTDFDITPYQLFVEWLDLGSKEVHIKNWSMSLAQMVPNYVVRFRRDYAKLLNFARANAFINQCNREIDDKGHIISTLDDYEVSRRIMEPVISIHLHNHASDKVIELIKIIKKLLEDRNNGDELNDSNSLEISTTQLGKAMGRSQATAHRYVTEAIGGGFIINNNQKYTKRIMSLEIINDDMSDEFFNNCLPTTNELKERIENDEFIATFC